MQKQRPIPPVYQFGHPNSGTLKKHFFRFLFSVVFHQKNFTKHLFQNGLEDKNAETREKTTGEKDVEAKEEIVYKSVFIHLNT